ncbi:MAG TPA: PIN domain-containing protein [Ferruginibacter sp.]|nr:PIN domain-containing protein [Ferruginibacter sp.]HMP20503.1 PIN domain-containing protein [Ferruginibacter sp.]
MKQIFLDTNVIIDFLADRKPFSVAATGIFNYAVLGKIRLYISAVSYNNIYYILRQSFSNAETIKLLDELSQMTEIADVTKAIIKTSLKSDLKDFEDAIQYNCALSLKKIDFIVTRNTKDFKKSVLPVMNPDEALILIESDGK